MMDLLHPKGFRDIPRRNSYKSYQAVTYLKQFLNLSLPHEGILKLWSYKFYTVPLCNLKGILFIIVALQVARKIASCNMALRSFMFIRFKTNRKGVNQK